MIQHATEHLTSQLTGPTEQCSPGHPHSGHLAITTNTRSEQTQPQTPRSKDSTQQPQLYPHLSPQTIYKPSTHNASSPPNSPVLHTSRCPTLFTALLCPAVNPPHTVRRTSSSICSSHAANHFGWENPYVLYLYGRIFVSARICRFTFVRATSSANLRRERGVEVVVGRHEQRGCALWVVVLGGKICQPVKTRV